jgi:hypothetical protein
MKIAIGQPEIEALDAALAEYGFSTEPGGANHGDEERYETLAALVARAKAGDKITIAFPAEVQALRHASWELGYSTETGGANEGSEAVEAQVWLIEELIAAAERAARADERSPSAKATRSRSAA